MQLSPHEQERLLVHVAADVAARRRERGHRLNHPEAVAVLTAWVFEAARDGRYDQVVLDTPPTRQALDFLEAPARIVGSAIGIGAFAGNLSGMAMIEFAGWSLDTGRGYLPMMLVCAVTYLVALAAIHLILPRIVAVDEEDGEVQVLAH